MASRRGFGLGFGVALVALATAATAQEKVLRIGMTAADIPRTLGQPDQGFEGNRFTGIPIYDALTQWDLSKEKEPSALIPGLATEWKAGEDKTKWVFKLRPGATFHDGSPVRSRPSSSRMLSRLMRSRTRSPLHCAAGSRRREPGRVRSNEHRSRYSMNTTPIAQEHAPAHKNDGLQLLLYAAASALLPYAAAVVLLLFGQSS